jgi:hypothetical protein
LTSGLTGLKSQTIGFEFTTKPCVHPKQLERLTSCKNLGSFDGVFICTFPSWLSFKSTFQLFPKSSQ